MGTNHQLRGLGLLPTEDGVLRTDRQIEQETKAAVIQLLAARGHDPSMWPVDVNVLNGCVTLSGRMPDRGTRRLLVIALEETPFVEAVDVSALEPRSASDRL